MAMDVVVVVMLENVVECLECCRDDNAPECPKYFGGVSRVDVFIELSRALTIGIFNLICCNERDIS
jgi:hypothetical protein